MRTISINVFAVNQHGWAVEEKIGPKDKDVEFAWSFCRRLEKELGAIGDQMVTKLKVGFYKYPFGGLEMKLKIAMTEPRGEDFEVQFEMDTPGYLFFPPDEQLEKYFSKKVGECATQIRQAIQSRIDLPKKKQNDMTKLLKETRATSGE